MSPSKTCGLRLVSRDSRLTIGDTRLMTHLIDRIGAVVVSRGPRHLRFFADGWGNSEHLTDLSLPTDPPQPVAIE